MHFPIFIFCDHNPLFQSDPIITVEQPEISSPKPLREEKITSIVSRWQHSSPLYVSKISTNKDLSELNLTLRSWKKYSSLDKENDSNRDFFSCIRFSEYLADKIDEILNSQKKESISSFSCYIARDSYQVVQGAALVEHDPIPLSSLNPDKKNTFRVLFLCTAPWNLHPFPDIMHPQETKGVGTALMEASIRESLVFGNGTLALTSALHAVKFYEKLGFKPIPNQFDEDIILEMQLSAEDAQKFLRSDRTGRAQLINNYS